MYIWGSAFIVLLVIAWVVYVDYIPKAPAVADYVPSETEPEVAVQEIPPVESSEQITLPAEVAPENQAVSSEAVSDAESSPVPVVASEAPSAETVPAAGQAIVRIKAKERSWVSITDRDNKNIFDKIMVADIEETVQGQPPLQVVIGNAPSTTLIFNNRPIDLAPVTNDRVARLKLE
jgi:cytoskeleton protein RodZ